MSKKIIVIGAGAAGMMAAISANIQGAEVVLLERNDRIGKKLLATGNGRCNYTNKNLSIKNYHGENPKFAYSGLSQFNVDSTIDFFEVMGITPAMGDGGKVFPLSFQSSSMVDILKHEIENSGINLITEAYVVRIECKHEQFNVILKDDRVFNADKLIIATGGMALPNSGSDGNGYKLCEDLGHTIVDVIPGLVQLNLEGNHFKRLNGTKFVGRAELYVDGKMLIEETGDILFTSYGISGPPILDLSRTAIYNLNKGKTVEVSVSIIHHMNLEKLYEYLMYRFAIMTKKTVEMALIGFINKNLIVPILREVNIDKNKMVINLSKSDIRKISEILNSWKFRVTGSQPWAHAQITAGGVNTNEVDNKTMQSKIVDGLYIVGELLDVDGDCGGYNLQWAWSSGYIAGERAVLN